MTSKYTFGKAVLLFFIVFSLFLTIGNSYAHSGLLNKVAVEAYAKKIKSQFCQYEGGHNDLYIGTCQYISDTDLICVRNQPIRKIEGNKIESEIDHDV